MSRYAIALLCGGLAFAQAQLSPRKPDPLHVVVLEGQRQINRIGSKTASAVVVEVRDETETPVSGATVVFRLPPSGAGADFPDGKLEQKAVTNRQGQAATFSMLPNNRPGRFEVLVEATLGARSGSAVVVQENGDAEAKKPSGRWWKVALAVGTGVATTALTFGLRRGGGSNSATTGPPPSLTITPGPISVGGPR